MSSKKYGSQFLKGLTSFRVPEELTSQAIEEYLSALDCPRSLTVALLFRNKEFEQLINLECDPHSYESMKEFRDAYQATEFLSKYKAFAMEVDREQVALQKFKDFEFLCKQTNLRFKDLGRDRKFQGRAVRLHSAIVQKISRILGEFDVEEFFSRPDWGPGASTLIKRRDASPVKKFQCETGITRDLYSLIPLPILEDSYPLWSKQLNLNGFPNFQVGNKVITVPKNAKTDRVIAVEPGINLWFQLSIGRMIGRRLLRYGVDLRLQSKNQEMARSASISGRVATIDLSSASDSIAKAIVEEIIPPKWFSVMDSCRSRYGVLDGQVSEWAKFSSMGNGFTFQLESLIFLAIALCCAEYQHVDVSDVSVYGDDIILPSACLELFSEMLDFYGFLLNKKKSHYDSPFRESCGAHYYSGSDVKPIYLKDELSSIPAIYRLANAIRRQAHRRNNYFGCDSRLRKTFEHLVSFVPSALRLRIPETLGDGGFISNLDEALPSQAGKRRKYLGFEGWLVPNLVEVSRTYFDDTEGYLLAALWKLPTIAVDFYRERKEAAALLLRLQKTGNESAVPRLQAIAAACVSKSDFEGYNSVPLAGRVRRRVAMSLVQQWYDLGPWF